MTIAYLDPLSRAWNRMKKALFQPFDISKWFVVGFTAFLAGLIDYHGGNNGNFSKDYGRSRWDWDGFTRFPDIASEWIIEHAFWFSLIIFGIIFLIALVIVLTWLSSRGKFMFLDNVVYNKAEVSKPWREYSKEGNSLFIWRLIYGFICFILFILFLIFCFIMIRNMHYGYFSPPGKVLMIIAMILQFLVFIILTAYISLFLNDFIVPIMYKNKITTSQAWYRFLPILSQHFIYFFLYGLFIFLMGIVVVICVLLFGFFTCCIGIVLLIIPYIGSVILLPVSYTFPARSVEFLEQFGPEFS
ncbi:MAG: hypothetical protein H8D45_07965, partial [Bacteroidetes bacterium]|nr:hypothetical protein [Bacteroidota bacterium]